MEYTKLGTLSYPILGIDAIVCLCSTFIKLVMFITELYKLLQYAHNLVQNAAKLV